MACETVYCHCGLVAQELTVTKNTVNRGRIFLTCPENKQCLFFRWVTDPIPMRHADRGVALDDDDDDDYDEEEDEDDADFVVPDDYEEEEDEEEDEDEVVHQSPPPPPSRGASASVSLKRRKLRETIETTSVPSALLRFFHFDTTNVPANTCHMCGAQAYGSKDIDAWYVTGTQPEMMNAPIPAFPVCVACARTTCDAFMENELVPVYGQWFKISSVRRDVILTRQKKLSSSQ